MAEILTTRYKTDALREFYTEITNSDVYIFVAGIERYSINPENSQASASEFLSKTLFGKIVKPQDTKYMIKYVPWNQGDVYVQYDDAVDLEDERFYAVVGPTNNDTGDYRVYKCLFNNYGAEVVSPPNYEETTPNQIYRTAADGYIWKHMYAISLIEFEAYNALGYIPITGTFDVDPIANTTTYSTISDVFVENIGVNYGYVQYDGNVVATIVGNEIQVNSPDIKNNIDTHEEGYFVGQTLKCTQQTGAQLTFYYRILAYEWDNGTGRAIFTVAGTPGSGGDGLTSQTNVSVIPSINIIGDGSGALAVPEIVDNRINSVTVIEPGSGYRVATAVVVDPLFGFKPEDTSTIDVRAEIRPVLSPRGDHGYSLLDELKCKHFLLYGYITGDDNNRIGATNTYNGVGVVKNPLFANTSPGVFDNRIAIITDDIGFVSANGSLSQVDGNNDTIFTGKVHEIDLVANTVYIAEYVGSYQPQPGSDISLDINRPFITESGVIITPNGFDANNVIVSEYQQLSGEVYYMEDFFPLERNSLSREEFKIVLEF